jgi:hypothetical protein
MNIAFVVITLLPLALAQKNNGNLRGYGLNDYALAKGFGGSNATLTSEIS